MIQVHTVFEEVKLIWLITKPDSDLWAPCDVWNCSKHHDFFKEACDMILFTFCHRTIILLPAPSYVTLQAQWSNFERWAANKLQAQTGWTLTTKVVSGELSDTSLLMGKQLSLRVSGLHFCDDARCLMEICACKMAYSSGTQRAF